MECLLTAVTSGPWGFPGSTTGKFLSTLRATSRVWQKRRKAIVDQKSWNIMTRVLGQWTGRPRSSGRTTHPLWTRAIVRVTGSFTVVSGGKGRGTRTWGWGEDDGLFNFVGGHSLWVNGGKLFLNIPFSQNFINYHEGKCLWEIKGEFIILFIYYLLPSEHNI